MHRLVVIIVFASVFVENHAQWQGYSSRKGIKGRPMLNGRSLFSCKHSICNHVKGYPEGDINMAMENKHSLKLLLEGTLYNATSDVVIESRIQTFDARNSSQLCNVEGPATFRPKAMRNLSNQWRYIVNTDRYQQVFTVEACRELSSPNANEARQYCTDVLQNDCRQNYQSLSLLVYEQSKIQFDVFLVPSTCKCCTG